MKARLAGLLLLCGCGSFLPEPPVPDAGRACVQDSECVPNGCCGQGTAAVQVMDAPTSCAQLTCSGMCPVAQVRCGCGVPVCRDSRCTVAVATDPACQ